MYVAEIRKRRLGIQYSFSIDSIFKIPTLITKCLEKYV